MHEAFCQAYVAEPATSGRNARAAIKAGYSNEYASQQANKLKALPTVRARLKELEGITGDEESAAELWREEIRDVVRLAKKEQDYGPAIRGLEIIGKSKGFLNETLNLNAAQKISDEQLASMFFEIAGLVLPKDAMQQITPALVVKMLTGPRGEG